MSEELEKLKSLKIPEYLRGKKFLVTAEMFVEDIGNALLYFTSNLPEEYSMLNKDGQMLVIKQYVIGHLEEIYRANIDSKLEDPDQLS